MNVIELNEERFETEVLQSPNTVLVDFYADWCGPCRMLAPVMEEIAEALAGKVKVCRVNTDTHMALATRYNVNALPTVIVFRNGAAVDSWVGYHTRQQILDKIR